MATAINQKVVKNVGQLKSFLKDIPDTVSIFGEFGDRQEAFLWKKDSDESGPKFWFSLDDELK